MKISLNGLNFIKNNEGEVLTAYLDTGGVWTIGVGHTQGVTKGMVITADQSRDFLNQDTATAQAAVNKLVTVPLTQNQFDALVDFVFNVGVGNFSKSSLLGALNKGDYQTAANKFLDWKYDNGKVIDGLYQRRVRTKALFLTPDNS